MSASREKEPGFFAQLLGFVNPALSVTAETTIRWMQSDRDQFAETPVPTDEELADLRREMDENGDGAPAWVARRAAQIPLAFPREATAPGAPGSIAAEWLYPESLDPHLDAEGTGTADAPTILYLHGGDYWAGSVRSHEDLIARLGRASGARALAINYSLAPGFRWPQQLMEALSAYAFLVDRCQTRPSSIVIMGDSAGGNLSLVTALCLALFDAAREGEPIPDFAGSALDTFRSSARSGGLPAALVLLSPWVNLDIEREASKQASTFAELAATDYLPTVEPDSALYFLPPGAAPDLVCSPLVSPCFAGRELLSRLPPTLISYGGGEQLKGQIEWFCRSFAAANQDDPGKLVQIGYDGMPHVFHAFGAMIPEAEVAIDAIGTFVKGRLG